MAERKDMEGSHAVEILLRANGLGVWDRLRHVYKKLKIPQFSKNQILL